MAISLSSLQKGRSVSPPILCLYGDEGIGKSRFAANAPNPVFIFTENSLGNLDVVRWQATSYEDVMEMTLTLLNEKHDFNTVVYDTLDWFEGMLWAYLIKDRPKTEKGFPVKDISDYGFGKGYGHAIDYWNDFLALVERLRVGKNMAVVFLAHSTRTKISPPDGDSYDSWTLKLQNSDKISAKDKITEYCDEVLFANWRMGLTEDEGKDRKRGVGSGERIVYTEKRPAWDAKNRHDLPAQIHVKDRDWADVWDVLAANIPWFKQFAEPAPKQKTVAEPVTEDSATPKFLQNKQPKGE